MGVKDLVGVYEASASDLPSSDTGMSRRSQRGTHTSSLPLDTPLASGSSRRPSPGRTTRDGSPPPRSARFLQHSWLQSTGSRPNENKDIPMEPIVYDVPESDLGAVDTRSLLGNKSSLKESLPDYYGGIPSPRSSAILASSRYTRKDELPPDSYAASLTAVANTEDDTVTLASSSTAVHLYPTPEKDMPIHLRSHNSVPAAVVFARYSAPLFLPKLDKYLVSLPIPEFAKSSRGKGKDVIMFPPMERLTAEKKSLDDLEHNGSATPAWRRRNTWFGVAISAVLGITVRTNVESSALCHGSRILHRDLVRLLHSTAYKGC